MKSYPIARELVLIGGGHSHVIFLRMLAMQPIPGLKVTLVSPELRTPYSGMLPGFIAGHYSIDDVYIDLVPLCRFADVAYIQSSVTGLSVAEQQVHLDGSRPALRYDYLSIDIGSTPAVSGLKGFDDVISVKPISSFLQHWQSFTARIESNEVSKIGFVGAGAGGVELCLSVNHYLRNTYPQKTVHINLFTEGKTVLADYPVGVRIRFERILNEQRIQVHRDFRVIERADNSVGAGDGRSVPIDELFWVTQASSQSWPAESGLAVDAQGFIHVDDALRSVSHPNVFAVGDCATMINHIRPKAGVYAVRQGKPLFQNVCAVLLGEKLKNYTPQRQFLSLISTGARHAVASRNGLNVEGQWVWRWKNWIDQRFMDRFSKLPAMKRTSENILLDEFDEQMYCGGCGSKVSADLLSEVLSELLGSDFGGDDAARINVPVGMQLLQSVDHFRSFVDDPYQQARIAVCHAVSDIYACGGKPTQVMALLTLPFAKPAVTRSLLRQILSGTLDQLHKENIELIGGHTSEGMELSIGFSANGLVKEDRFWAKQGLQSGDCLVLTKALGTGAIFAADMQYRARGQWVEGALTMMSQSNRIAWEVLQDFDVHACTDVTGFGLAGHALEMLREGQGLSISRSDLPVLDGALQCIEDLQITSSLHESNKRSCASLISSSSVSGTSDEILFDPQTSGGLLVSVSASDADQLIEKLRVAGCNAAAVVAKVTGSGLLEVS